MTAVFSHGRLRLYLLKLLAEGPKHGYELIRLLENRFLGLYAPSAGTIYPRLSRMEVEGLVSHTAAGGRKVYQITDAGRAELTARAGELAELETEIHASVADLSSLANDIEREVSGSVRDLKRELRDARDQARTAQRPRWSKQHDWSSSSWDRRSGGKDAFQDLERSLNELTGEARRLARSHGVSDADLHAASAVVASALTELRRLLRPR
ncbi:MAG TPA: PadR family transcriptional regulator [Micromonosporaceae bacterium]